MAIIHIVERATGKTCASVPVSVHSPSPDELFNEAWSTAVDDKAVDAARRLDYSFVVEEDADQP
ncbi:hypothetical protein BH10PSE17_BH10PSE17_26240 [soil metagenome]